MRVTVEFDAGRHTDQADVNLVVRTPRRWLRLHAAYGTPPGSHIGLWHTDTGATFGGAVHGWNLRIGRRYTGPCLTLLAHTRPERTAPCASS